MSKRAEESLDDEVNPEELVPSYEEATRTRGFRGPSIAPDSKQARSTIFNIRQYASYSREQRIQRLVDEQIISTLQAQLLEGFTHRALIFLPADSPVAQYQADNVEIVSGIPDNLSHKTVGVQGDEYNKDFFLQRQLVDEVDLTLKARLAADGNRIAGSSRDEPVEAPPAPQPTPPEASSAAQNKGLKSFFSRKPKEPPTPVSPTSTILTNLGWRNETEERIRPPLASDEIRIDVSLRDIYIREETEMGLKTTTKYPAIWIDFEVGC